MFILSEHEHTAGFTLPDFLLTDRPRTRESADPTVRVIRACGFVIVDDALRTAGEASGAHQRCTITYEWPRLPIGSAGHADSVAGPTDRRMTQFLSPFGRTYSKPTRSYKPRVPLYRNEEDIFFSPISCG